MLAMPAHETFHLVVCTRGQGKSTVTLPPSLVKGVGQNHACVISRAIVRTTDTLVSVRLPDCEITLFKFLKHRCELSVRSRIPGNFGENYFTNALYGEVPRVSVSPLFFSIVSPPCFKVKNNYTCNSIDFHSVVLFVESLFSFLFSFFFPFLR